jgi:hypothetical protein
MTAKEKAIEELNLKLAAAHNEEQRDAILMDWANKYVTVNGKRVKFKPNDPDAEFEWKVEGIDPDTIHKTTISPD